MDQQTVVNVLAWAFAVVGSSFCVLLAWFGVRMVSQLDKITDMVTQELHRLDLRVAKLEVKQGMARRAEDE